MALDQITNTIEKTESEKISELRQEAMRLNDEKTEMLENGTSVNDPILKYTEDKLSKILSELSSLEGNPVEVAENIAENKFNEVESKSSEIESQKKYHEKLFSRATELNTLYVNKKAEAEEKLQTLQAGSPEYVVTANLITQYEKQIASSQVSMDSNKIALEKLEKSA